MLARRTRTTRISWRTSAPFLAFHAVPLAALWTGVTRTAVVLFVVSYAVRCFAVTAGYHRYFAHRAYRLGRVPQLLLAFLGLTAVQKGPLWWASHHRHHHRHADTDRDPHSPQMGFWWSHIGWILSGRYGATDTAAIEDFARYPELRWLDRHDWVGPWSLGVLSFLVGGWSGLVVGFFASTVLLWHVTFSVNSVAHLVGRRRYATADTSRNLLPLALLSFGEGWHNNHHHHPTAARQGFRWWEVDVSYGVLRLLAAVGIVRDLREPSPAALRGRRIADGALDVGMVRHHLGRAAGVAEAGRANGAGAVDEVLAVLDAAADGVAALARAERVRAGRPNAEAAGAEEPAAAYGRNGS